MHYYEVAPNRIVRAGADFLTYHSETPLEIGQIVGIEIGKKAGTGVIFASVKKPSYDTKPIDKIIEPTPLPAALLKTLTWMSEYYCTPLAQVLQTALPRGLEKKRRQKPTPSKHALDPVAPITFTDDQTRAIAELDAQTHGSTLLHGITGSGKTAVYIDQAAKAITHGKSAIILVPEIALTSQLVAEFSRHFENVIVTHSVQTEAERHQIWRQCLNSQAPCVVIGPRSALFMPLAHLGLVVVDEMHEPSFKQEQSPRYSALRVASILGRHHTAKIIFGSATPMIADYYSMQQAHQPIIEMRQLARQDAIKPTVNLVDMTKRHNFSSHRFISNTLFTQINQTLSSDKQVLIFHNRRGSAPITLCENCGWQAGCPRCFVPLILHSDTHLLQCHICGYSDRVPTSCPVCHDASIIHKGIGTKLIESELRKLFPRTTIARFDGDTQADNTVDRRFNELRNGAIQIIVGTQVIAKGLDLPQLRTVGVIQADAGLSLPDFGASERTFQLLAQVIGRVGRSHHPTNVIVQSFQPEHPAVQLGLNQDYTGFYNYALALRKHANFPPFRFLLKLVCIYKTETAAVRNAQKLAGELRTHLPASVELLGPTPAFYERQRDTYRWQIVLKSTKRAELIAALAHLPATHWQFELDPTSLL